MPRPLYDMFNAVPRHYDLVNRIITWGLDRQWRGKAAGECLISQPEKVLDLCCGTGDLAIHLSRRSTNGAGIIGLDYSRPMLNVAMEKTKALDRRPFFIAGDASTLPFPDGYFDCVGISFAFRNLTYKNPLAREYLSEVIRILKPGGRFVIVESSQPENKLIRSLFHLYLRSYVLRIGTRISGNRGAYRYLAESASRFYTPQELKRLLLDIGFSKVTYRPLLFGAAGIHIATR